MATLPSMSSLFKSQLRPRSLPNLYSPSPLQLQQHHKLQLTSRRRRLLSTRLQSTTDQLQSANLKNQQQKSWLSTSPISHWWKASSRSTVPTFYPSPWMSFGAHFTQMTLYSTHSWAILPQKPTATTATGKNRRKINSAVLLAEG